MVERAPGWVGRWLLVVAAPGEARAVLGGLGGDPALADRPWERHEAGPLDVVVCGVGKSNAAGAAGRFLDPARHSAAVSLGIGGSLPVSGAGTPVPLGCVVVASASVFADEGLQSDGGFTDQAGLGFPPAPGVGAAIPADPSLAAALMGAILDACGPACREGPIATVSTCSGTSGLALEVAGRTGGLVEAMEGAAVGLVAHRLGIAFGEVRGVSNTTGSRTAQVWDLRGALSRLSDVASALARAGSVRPGGAGEA